MDEKPFQAVPTRSPLAIIEAIRPYITGKVFCDLDAGEGDILIAAKKYAKEVIGLEGGKRPIVAEIARDRGLNVEHTRFFTLWEFPPADVYYVWTYSSYMPHALSIIKKGILIMGADPQAGGEVEALEALNTGGKWIDVPYNEGEGYREHGVFKLLVVECNQ